MLHLNSPRTPHLQSLGPTYRAAPNRHVRSESIYSRYTAWEANILPSSDFAKQNQLIEQFGAFIPWLVINRGPLSALIHPNTDDALRDHSQRATWMGERLPLNLGPLKPLKEQKSKNGT